MPLVLLFLLCLFPLGISAQSTVKGIVNDETGQPIIGVTVRVVGTKDATVTDMDGKFAITASPKASLSFSYVGYNPQTVVINGRSNLSITLKEESSTLNDVVVIGYGTAKRSDISGSVTSVNTQTMMKKAPLNVAQGLQGAAAGVIVVDQDGAPSAMSQVRIRGVGTINGSADPLFVVDGVQVGSNANFLNPSDIENIEVLKDASATAIYGSRGANGVVLITTKHGSKGAIHVDVNVNFGIQTLASTLNTLDVDTYAKAIRQAHANDGKNVGMDIFLEKYDGQRKQIDWQKEMTRSALRQNYTVGLSGGTDKFQATFSAGYLKNDGIVVNTNYQRMNVRGTMKAQVTNYLELGGDLNYTHDESNGSNVGFGNNGNLSSVRDYATLVPTMDYTDASGNIIHPNVVNADGTYGTFWQTSATGYEVSGATDSYYARQMEIENPTRNNRVLANVYADLTLMKGLHAKTILSYNHNGTDSYSWGTPVHRYNNGQEVAMQGIDLRRTFSLSQTSSYDKSIETYLTYHWSNDIHDITAMAGNSVSQSKGYWVNASAKDFPAETIRQISLTNDLTTKDGGGGFNLQSRFISYYGRLMYSLMSRYNLTATVRRDGSSNFGAGNRWGTFPSAAASWRISEEPFMKGISAVSNVKLRLGWGRTGNAGSPTSSAVPQLGSSSTSYHFYTDGATSQNFVTANGMAQLIIADTNLKWETNEQTNVGLDFSLLHGDLSVALDYFVRNSKDLLLNVSVRPSSGYLTYYTNFGEIRNKGFEFNVNYNHRINSDWTVGATLNGSTLKNKIIACGNDIWNTCSGGNDGSTIDGSNVQAIDAESFGWKNHSICREGYAVGSYYGYRAIGIVRDQATLDELNKAAGGTYQEGLGVGDIYYKDLNGDGKVTESDVEVIGNGFPKLNFGLTLNATYKNWDFSLYTYGVLGQDILSYSAMRLSIMKSGDSSDPSVPNILKDSYKESFTNNPNGSLPRLSIAEKSNYKTNSRVSDFWIKNGDFLKINNIQIGYTFPKMWLEPLKVTSARAYVAVSNLACISGYNKYGDPECGQGSVIYTGLDSGRYPMPRTYSIGLSVQF
jgi:TonB-linked SusC/RagA family outer membrane protein